MLIAPTSLTGMRSGYPLSLGLPPLRSTQHLSKAPCTPAEKRQLASARSSEPLEAGHRWICFTVGMKTMKGYSNMLKGCHQG